MSSLRRLGPRDRRFGGAKPGQPIGPSWDSLNLLPTKSYFFLRMRLSALAARYAGTLRRGRRVLSNDGAAFTRAVSPTGRATRQDRDLSPRVFRSNPRQIGGASAYRGPSAG